MVSQELVDELKLIIKEDYQIELEPDEATEVANALVSYFDLLARIEFETQDLDEELNLDGQ